VTPKQKLELTWIGKDHRPKLEPRILLADPDQSYHAQHRVTDQDIFDNQLIFGDNLLALKALEAEFTGKVKCVFIDPPYNTGSAFEHYNDGLEHSIWLSMMRDRLEIIRRLLSEDGSLWITIDDNEAHYLKVMGDEIFGRNNFIANVIWQKKYAPANDAKWLSDSHDHVLVYARNKEIWRPNKLLRSEDSKNLKNYKNPDNDPRGVWRADNYTCNKTSEERPNLYYPIYQPNTGKEIYPNRSRVWSYSQERHRENEKSELVWWGVKGTNNVPAYKRFLKDIDTGVIAQIIWEWKDVGHTQDGKKEQLQLHPSNPFSTPKPEKVIQRILELATNPGDLVLDSFAGSGTTGAVAHKMGRRWIMIELGKHCHTHIIPRLKKVIDGDDQGGITKAVDWGGGGGFRYYRLAPSLLEQDQWGNWIINKTYNAAMLSEALCKLEGFTYAPSDIFYWQHGYSSEQDFLYVTTQTLSHEQLAQLADEVGNAQTLLVLCPAFRGNANGFTNLTVKKIPKQVLSRCEWGHDDYSLKVENLPQAPPKLGQLDLNLDSP
jgi:adenine-specific DNA-methyltransferase